MNTEQLRFLLSPTGQELLARMAETTITPHNHLQIAARLRQQLDPALAQAVVETTALRQKAAAKFSRAAAMYFTRAGLEQTSAEPVAGYRAGRFAQAGMNTLVDLGCGLGGDALALAQTARVIGVDLDEMRLRLARENVRVYGGNGRFQPLLADIETLPPMPIDGVFFDPARRDENGRRIYAVQDYRPPLSTVDKWREKAGGTAVKISPGVHYHEIPAEAEVEFISLHGEVKEGVLWYDDLRTGAGRQATVLPGPHTLISQPHPETPLSAPLAYLYEPDGAVIRAHLVQELAHHLNACKIDQDIAYLTAETQQPTPFAHCYQVEAAFPFQLKRLRHYLRQHNIGRVTIKKRGSPLEVEWLRSQLRLQGTEHRVLILTQINGKAAVIVAQPL